MSPPRARRRLGIALRKCDRRKIAAGLAQETSDREDFVARRRLARRVRAILGRDINLGKPILFRRDQRRLIRVVGGLNIRLAWEICRRNTLGLKIALHDCVLAQPFKRLGNRRLLIPMFGNRFFQKETIREQAAQDTGEGLRIVAERGAVCG